MSDQPDRDDEVIDDPLGRGPLRTMVFEAMAEGAEWRRRERGLHDEPVDVDR